MVDVTMPQLGETVTEGTVTRWFKQVGDEVALDEALFETARRISRDNARWNLRRAEPRH